MMNKKLVSAFWTALFLLASAVAAVIASVQHPSNVHIALAITSCAAMITFVAHLCLPNSMLDQAIQVFVNNEGTLVPMILQLITGNVGSNPTTSNSLAFSMQKVVETRDHADGTTTLVIRTPPERLSRAPRC